MGGPGDHNGARPGPLRPPGAERREVDLLNATIFGVHGQGGMLRELEGLRMQMRRNSQAIIFGALAMMSALIALAVAVANHY